MSVRKALDAIGRLFPAERVAEATERFRAVWLGKVPKDRLPFVMEGVPVPNAPVTPEAVLEAACSPEESLHYQLAAIEARCVLDDDFVPSLFPGLRQGTLPSVFGATERHSSGHFWVEPVITTPAHVHSLPEPDFACPGPATMMLEIIRYFHQQTAGRLPIHICDMQGPLSVAGQLWGAEQFMLAMYDHPMEVHALLARTTEAVIRYARMLIEAAGGDLLPIHSPPSAWMPLEAGIALSEDLTAVLSPQLLAEYLVPYVNRIAEAFGGAVIHSCGDISSRLDVLLQIRKLRGVDFCPTETPLAAAVGKLGNRVIIVHNSGVSCAGLPLLSPEEYVSQCTRVFNERGVPAILFVNSFAPAENVTERMRLARLAALYARNCRTSRKPKARDCQE